MKGVDGVEGQKEDTPKGTFCVYIVSHDLAWTISAWRRQWWGNTDSSMMLNRTKVYQSLKMWLFIAQERLDEMNLCNLSGVPFPSPGTVRHCAHTTCISAHRRGDIQQHHNAGRRDRRPDVCVVCAVHVIGRIEHNEAP